jgi:insulysin
MEKNIIIPKNEKRIFTGGKLANDIKYMAINDNDLDMTSVVVTVNIGSLAEDADLKYQGLAHFLEHMLFLGSVKYPKMDEYNNLINSNGGSSNAYTENTKTTYHFSIYNNFLDKALDIFSRFFIDPLFNPEFVNKELQAVHSEHSKNINNDGWCSDYFKDIISKKDSIINRFKTGNLSSLDKPGIRDEMIKFYNKYYIPSNISIVTTSSLDNDVMTDKINKTFGNIPKKTEQNIIINKPLYPSGNQYYFLKSNDDIYKLTYIWEIPHTDNFKDTHLPWIITSVINSKNENSLKQFLIKKGLIKGISSYVVSYGSIILDIYMHDFHNWQEIDSYIRHYINSLQNHNWYDIIDYYKKKDKIYFDYSSKEESLNLALFISSNIFDYPIEKVYSGPSIVENIDDKGMIRLLANLNFDNNKIILSSKEKPITSSIIFKDEYREPYYNLIYYSIELKFIEPQKIYYEIITENEFLDTKPELILNLDDTINPTLVSNYGGKVWFGNISKFNETIIEANLIFTNLQFIFDMKNLIDINLFLSYLQSKVREKFNLPFEIGFHSSLTFKESTSQIILEVSGYNDKFNLLFNQIVEYIKSFSYDSHDVEMLNSLIKRMLDSYTNMTTNTPYLYVGYIENLSINKYSYKREDIISYLKSINVSTFVNRINELKNLIFYQSKFTSFIYGNIDYNSLFKNENQLVLDFPSIEKPRNILKLKKSIQVTHPNSKETNNYVKFAYYIGSFDPINNLLLLVLSIGFSNLFYSDLRSKQQFGYIVHAGISGYQKNYYFEEIIQSEKSIEDIEKAILKFNNGFLDLIDEIEFNKFVESAKNIIEEKDTQMSDLINRFLSEIVENTFIFNRKQLLLNQIKNIDYQTYKNFYKNKIINGKLSKIIIKVINK